MLSFSLSRSSFLFAVHHSQHLTFQATHAGTHNLVHQQYVNGNDGGGVENLLLHDVVVKNAQIDRFHRLAGRKIQPDRFLVQQTLLLQPHDRVLGVVPTVHGQNLRHHQHGVRVRLNREARLSLHRLGVLAQLVVHAHLERTRSRHQLLVLDRIVDRAQPIADRVLDLGQRVLVRALHQNRHRQRVLAVLHERVLVLAQHVLVHLPGKAEARFVHVVERVHRHTATGQRQTLHIAALGTAQRHDALLRQHVQRHRIDALLVDHDERFVRTVAHLALQLDHLLHPILDEFSLGQHELFALLRRLIEEARVDLRLFVLHRHVARENVRIFHALRHVRVASTVVHHDTLHQLRVRGRLVLHLHQLDHVQIDRFTLRADGQHRIDAHVRQQIGQIRVHLGAERGARNVEQIFPVHLNRVGDLFENVQRLQPGLVEPVRDDARMQPVRDVQVGLLQQLANDQHDRGGSVPGHIVLGRTGTGNQRRGRMLDLHLVQQHIAVLGDFDVTGTRNQPVGV
uniref:Uncharacterized protein n=1 Tax=Anopheles coluzzii TaxID=1518534 RepID=A0A8W7PAJ3_ANOCL